MLLDLALPDMPGLAVLEALKGDASLRRIPVVAISAAQDRERNLGGVSPGCELIHFQARRSCRLYPGHEERGGFLAYGGHAAEGLGPEGIAHGRRYDSSAAGGG